MQDSDNISFEDLATTPLQSISLAIFIGYSLHCPVGFRDKFLDDLCLIHTKP
jgi:hypothetical protein